MITQERVEQLFYYDSGKLIRKISVNYNAKKGDIAGSYNGDGYREVRVDSESYLVHRIIFLWYHGFLPLQVDHHDTDRSNDRISNLRPATAAENSHNSKIRKDNTSGVKGVGWREDMQKWRAYIHVNNKHIHIGYFKLLENAVVAIRAARIKYHGEFANHG